MKVNQKSDFHFILKLMMCVKREDGTCEKREVGWPDHDWTAKLWTSTSLNRYVVSRKGDTLVNCFNDNGRIHVVCNNHKLHKGRLQCEFHAELPNDIYPDGIEDLYEPQPLDIELVDGPGDCATVAEVEMMQPYIKGDRGDNAYPVAYMTLVTSGGCFSVPVLAPGIEYTPSQKGYGYYYSGTYNTFSIGDWDI